MFGEAGHANAEIGGAPLRPDVVERDAALAKHARWADVTVGVKSGRERQHVRAVQLPPYVNDTLRHDPLDRSSDDLHVGPLDRLVAGARVNQALARR